VLAGALTGLIVGLSAAVLVTGVDTESRFEAAESAYVATH
jgi:hypothetical protein